MWRTDQKLWRLRLCAGQNFRHSENVFEVTAVNTFEIRRMFWTDNCGGHKCNFSLTHGLSDLE